MVQILEEIKGEFDFPWSITDSVDNRMFWAIAGDTALTIYNSLPILDCLSA